MRRWNGHLVYKCIALCLLFASPGAQAELSEPFFQWHSSNVQLLRGSGYALGSKERTIVTVEHANGWRYGDFHFFLDQTWPDDNKPYFYFEPTLRFSLSKITGNDFSYGIVKDVLISSNIEKPKGQEIRYLGGLSVDFDLPGFKYFKSNYWVRNNQELSGSTYQITLVWNRPFKIAGADFLVEGFADFAGSEGSTVAHQLIVPRFLVDAGSLTGMQKNKLWLGVEWQYWHNKFGHKGVLESAPQLQMKWVI